MTGTDSGDYFLGHSDAEIERLAQQSAFYRDATEALLKSAGLAPGMRVGIKRPPTRAMPTLNTIWG